MIVDFVDLTSNDDEVVIGEEPSVHVNGYSVDGKKDIIDLTSEDEISEEENVAHGQGHAAQDTTLPKPEVIADDGQAEPAQCAATLQRQGEDDRQGDAAQCAVIIQGQKLTADDGQGDTTQCATTMLRQELTSDDGHDAAAQCTTTLQRQELSSYDQQYTGAHAMLQRQESDLDYGHVTQGTIVLQRQESVIAHGQGNAAQCTIKLQRQELLAVADSMQEAVQCENSSAEAATSLTRTQGSYKTPAFLSTPHLSTEEPFSRQFWKAGEYRLAAQAAINNGQNRLRIHPKFLHSNATSHKWPFGAIAELLDNAIDEVAHGATFVKIDKMKHSHDGDYSLVIQDNGGGMSPETLRYCMSFGFSQKCTTSSIGQYGNGFKTSTMRLGADVIVFSCTQDDRRTRSVGLLSYTFLTRTKCNDIFVPAVDYEFDALSSTFKRIMNRGEKHFSSNLSTLLKWSPFSTEDELLNQFSNMERHGTKIIVFNLWFNDASEMELDFVTNKEDILISGAPEVRAGHNTVEWSTQMHIASRFRYSLRVYASILYLHVPENFQIILCGRAVEPHYIAEDLLYRECIQYRPHVGVSTEVDAITTIGFLKGAPRLDIYGFNVYHKNRLILPFWPAGSWNRKKRGIAGVLEANFIRPTHDKQDFERTGLFQRLETRLKDMATEYWTHHCHLVGYITGRLPPPHYLSTAADNDDDNLTAQATTNTSNCNSRSRASEALHSCSSGYNRQDPLHVDASVDRMDYGACPSTSINVGSTLYKTRNIPQQSQTELCKRRNSCSVIYWRAQKRRNTNVYSDQPGSNNGTEMQEEIRALIHQNKMLNAECSELEAAGEQMRSKADKLQKGLNVWRHMYKNLTDELQFYRGLDMLHRRRHHNNSTVGFI